jgi:hypothetical protein
MQSELASNFELHRFILCGVLAFVGGLAICLGYVLFSKGAGLFKAIDKLAIKSREFSVSVTGMSAGGALMLTSVAWGFWSYSAVPRLEFAGNTIKITAVPSNGGSLASIELPYAKLAGSSLFSADKQKVGTISGVLIDSDSKARAFAVDVAESPANKKQILLDAKDFWLEPGSTQQLHTIYKMDQIKDYAIDLKPNT